MTQQRTDVNTQGWITEDQPDLVVRSYTSLSRNTYTDALRGTIAYDPDTKGLFYYSGSTWVSVAGGAINKVVRNITQSYPMLVVDDTVVADATLGSIVVTLQSTHAMKGREITIIKSDATINTVTATSVGADVIGGAGNNTFTLTMPNQHVQLSTSDTGGLWYTV